MTVLALGAVVGRLTRRRIGCFLGARVAGVVLAGKDPRRQQLGDDVRHRRDARSGQRRVQRIPAHDGEPQDADDLGISRTVLTERLNHLVEHEILDRSAPPVRRSWPPHRVTYPDHPRGVDGRSGPGCHSWEEPSAPSVTIVLCLRAWNRARTRPANAGASASTSCRATMAATTGASHRQR